MSLTLIPTPISNDYPLSAYHREKIKVLLKENPMLLVEEHKAARRRWLSWGLPRECIEDFILFNEHTQKNLLADVIKLLKEQRKVLLMSDCGTPAFCDPGTELVNSVHEYGFKLDCLPIDNSIIMALIMSGFASDEFHFYGFLPREKEAKKNKLKEIHSRSNQTCIIMDTPYRLKSLLKDLVSLGSPARYCLCTELTKAEQWILRGSPKELISQLPREKMEFVMIIRT